MHTALLFALSLLVSFSSSSALPGAALGAPSIYTSSIAFLSSLPGPAMTAGFDALASGAVIPAGTAANGITFDYDFGNVGLIATPGFIDGHGNAFATTSSPHALGTTDLDVLLDGDDLALRFASANAVGFFLITAETPGVTLFDGDVRVTAGGAVASLDVDAVQATLADGSRVYFLGIVDPVARFDAASLGTFGAGGEFAFNVDDVVTAVPEPTWPSLLPIGLCLLAVVGPRRPATHEATR